MSLLIDGYNLIYAAGIVGRGLGPHGLERSRMALLNFVAEAVDKSQLPATTVVFDAAGAPPGLPASLEHRGMAVRFSKGYPSADDLLEELIRDDSAPRRLTVVSSDHRVQRAARRRRAHAIDSDVWFHEAIERRKTRPAAPPPSAKPTIAGEDEVDYWLRQFGQIDAPPGDAIFPPGYADDLEA
ncbi:MAG TPA: NYN domain-containing protein [Pirellulales bacterium]|nr:NYN domain-containing protein [Pirellulales bacterium]